jgi:hypothetical protein
MTSSSLWSFVRVSSETPHSFLPPRRTSGTRIRIEAFAVRLNVLQSYCMCSPYFCQYHKTCLFTKEVMTSSINISILAISDTSTEREREQAENANKC